jgi:hypothetical protein
MHHLILRVIAVSLLLVALGCESYPLGKSKEEWQLLSPEQQAEAYKQQNAIDAENRRLAAEEDARRRQAEFEAAERHNAEMEYRYRNARFGDIVSINIEGGTMRFDGKDRHYEPLAFDLVRGEAREVIIRRVDKHSVTIKVVVRLSDDGRQVFFDDASDRRLTLSEKTWDRSQTYANVSHNNDNSDPRGVTFTVRYKTLRRR